MTGRMIMGLLLGVGFLYSPASAAAFATLEHTVTAPYEPMALTGSIATEKILLGELLGDPHMYEFAVGEDTPVRFILAQQASALPIPLSFILVRVNEGNRGVEEVGRLDQTEVVWQSFDDVTLGIDLIARDVYTAELTPGIYRVEVSAALNQGKYALFSGTVPLDTGYFNKIGEIRKVQRFFDVSPLALLATPHLYIPLGFVLLIVAFILTRRYQRSLTSHA